MNVHAAFQVNRLGTARFLYPYKLPQGPEHRLL